MGNHLQFNKTVQVNTELRKLYMQIHWTTGWA